MSPWQARVLRSWRFKMAAHLFRVGHPGAAILMLRRAQESP